MAKQLDFAEQCRFGDCDLWRMPLSRYCAEHEAPKDRLPAFVTRLVTKHRDFNMGDCWYTDLASLRDGAEPESRNADLADTLEWLVALHRGEADV